MAEAGEGHKNASGIGVYDFIQNLIKEGKYAWFVDRDKGHFAINWSQAPMLYHSKFRKRTDKISSRKASNNFRSALLNEKKGAKEYPQYQKRNEKGKIIERQFQMPPEKLKSLFGIDMLFTDDGIEQETASVASEASKNTQETANSSDTGFEEEMDTSYDDVFKMSEPDTGDITMSDSHLGNTRSEEICPGPSGITTHHFQSFNTPKEQEELKEPLQVKEGIHPLAGSVEGGLPFVVTSKEKVAEDDTFGEADFCGAGVVGIQRVKNIDPNFGGSSYGGFSPPKLEPGLVPVTAKTQAGQLLVNTSFLYVDHKTQQVLMQLHNSPELQSLFAVLEHVTSDGNTAQNVGLFTMQDQADILGETALQSDQSENEDRESDYFADGETSSCGSFELDVGLSDSDDGDGPCSQDGTPERQLSKTSNASLEESTSFEVLSEVGIQSGNDVDKKDGDDESYEEPSIGSSGTCTSDGESKKETSGKSTNSSDGASVKVPVAEFDNSVEKITSCDESCKEPCVLKPGFIGWLHKWRHGNSTTAGDEGMIRGGTQESYDTSVRQQEANVCSSHEETAKPKRHEPPPATVNPSIWNIWTRCISAIIAFCLLVTMIIILAIVIDVSFKEVIVFLPVVILWRFCFHALRSSRTGLFIVVLTLLLHPSFVGLPLNTRAGTCEDCPMETYQEFDALEELLMHPPWKDRPMGTYQTFDAQEKCFMCPPTLRVSRTVAAAKDAVNTSKVCTIATGKTTEIFLPRSDREGLKEFKEYRVWKDNVAFAAITKGALSARCLDGVLKQFCMTKVEFKIWNKTDLILMVNDTTHDDGGNFLVEHVFAGMEGNHKDKIILNIAKPTGAMIPSKVVTRKDNYMSPIFVNIWRQLEVLFRNNSIILMPELSGSNLMQPMTITRTAATGKPQVYIVRIRGVAYYSVGLPLNKTIGTCEYCSVRTNQECDAQEKCLMCPPTLRVSRTDYGNEYETMKNKNQTASTKTETAASKTTIKMHACKKGLLTSHYETDRDGNAVQDIEWKIKFPGTPGWINLFTCTNKPGLVCCNKHRTVLADGITLLNNSNIDCKTVTIKPSRNATHDYAEMMYQVHYFDHSVSPSSRDYEVNFTAQCVRIQEGRYVNLTKILLREWCSIDGTRFAYCNSCQLFSMTPDIKNPVPDACIEIQDTRADPTNSQCLNSSMASHCNGSLSDHKAVQYSIQTANRRRWCLRNNSVSIGSFELGESKGKTTTAPGSLHANTIGFLVIIALVFCLMTISLPLVFIIILKCHRKDVEPQSNPCGPCSQDGTPWRQISKTSNSSLEESTSFELHSYMEIQCPSHEETAKPKRHVNSSIWDIFELGWTSLTLLLVALIILLIFAIVVVCHYFGFVVFIGIIVLQGLATPWILCFYPLRSFRTGLFIVVLTLLLHPSFVGLPLNTRAGTCEDCLVMHPPWKDRPMGTYQTFDAQEKCFMCPRTLRVSRTVAAAKDAVNTSKVCTIATGKTTEIFLPRSDREGLKELKEYRVWKDNVAFAIITKGTLAARCANGVLKQFCLTKTEFKIWNKTDLILMVNDTTHDDGGNFLVEHVFAGMEGNHKDKIILHIAYCSVGLPLNKTIGTCEYCCMRTNQDCDAQEKCLMCPPTLRVSRTASTKTETSASKTRIKMYACMKGLLTSHYETDRDGNAVEDIEWKIKFPGTPGWINFFTCTNKPSLVCFNRHRTVLADGFTLLNNSNCGCKTVTIERSRNATHDYTQMIYQVHYFDHSVSPWSRDYEVNFTAQSDPTNSQCLNSSMASHCNGSLSDHKAVQYSIQTANSLRNNSVSIGSFELGESKGKTTTAPGSLHANTNGIVGLFDCYLMTLYVLLVVIITFKNCRKDVKPQSSPCDSKLVLSELVVTESLLRKLSEKIEISKDITGCWKEVAAKLGVSRCDIELIAENKCNQDKANALLITWIQQRGNGAKLGVLMEALKGIGQNNIAKKISGQITKEHYNM